MAAYADDPRLQDLLESRVRRHCWEPFDLSSRVFSNWFDPESNHLWVWIGMQTDLPVEHHGSDMDAVFGSATHAVHMPEHPWFGRVAGFSWRSLGGAKTFGILAREAADDFADVSDDPTGCWLGMLYRLFAGRRAVFILDQPHFASAFRHGDRIEIAGLPWNVFLTSAKAIEKLLEQESLSGDRVSIPASPKEGSSVGPLSQELRASRVRQLHRSFLDKVPSYPHVEDSKPAVGSASGQSADPHVSIGQKRGKIRVNGKEYAAKPEWCSVVESLIKADGHYVTGPTMQQLPGCKGKQIWKVIKDLEGHIPVIKPYLKHKGNKGYPLLNG
jgi:hypothetical protein